MSTLFAMSQVALFGRGRNPTAAAPASAVDADSKHSTGAPATATSAVEWAMPETSASTGQPARWRINSADLEDMMMRAAVGLGFDRKNRSTADVIDEHQEQQQQQQHHQQQQRLSRDDLVDEASSSTLAADNLNGLLPSSRGSSPLYRKAVGGGDYQLDHTLDTTAPSSPCTPSMQLRSLSAVSPTSTRSDEMAFQHQLSPQSSRPGAAFARTQPSGHQASSTSGRFGLKLLVSNSMAGTLIGKGGTRICEIKDEVRTETLALRHC